MNDRPGRRPDFARVRTAMTNILVVDDSFVDRRIVGGLLEQRSDFQVFYAEDGTDALRQMELQRPDLVVTDINMPQKNGLELVRAMRIHFAGVPVILITAQGSEELAVQASGTWRRQLCARKSPCANIWSTRSTM